MARFIDEEGNRYGRLIVLRRAEKKHQRGASIRWLCHCDCGNDTTVSGSNLRSGNTQSCGCLQRVNVSKALTVDLTDRKYARLLVIKRYGSDGHGKATWLCRCDCGNEIVVRGNDLRSGNTKSCGCLRKETSSRLHSLPKGVAVFNVLISSMKQAAEKRGYEWCLTKEQVKRLTKQPCYYCGAEPLREKTTASDTGTYVYNGLDRVNNSRGYVIDNVVACCATCNYAKKSMTVRQFRDWITTVYQHFASAEAFANRK